MMESSYANDNESFKKFLLDFCSNVIVENEESGDLPFRLVSKQLTPDELEAESLEWSIRYLSKYNCPHTLTAAISRAVYHSVRNIDISEVQDTKRETEEENKEEDEEKASDIIAEEKDIVLDAHKVCYAVIDFVHEVCKKWKDDLPEMSPPHHVLYSCSHEIKNTRRKMEDRHVSLPDINTLFELKNNDQNSFYAVFDGHAGMEAANYAAAHVPYHFVKSESFPRDPPGALKTAFKSTDENFIVKATRERLKSGSTGVLAFIEKNKLHISWLGDSQALLVKNGRSIEVMNPHKPEREDEQARIEALGGCILYMGTWRVNGNLSVSRALGDISQKKFISSDADTTTIELDGTEDYLILACDGLWDVMDFDMAVKEVYDHVQSVNGDLRSAAKHLVITAKDLGSSDNITVTVVFFKHDISPPEIPQLFNFGVSESQGKNDSTSSDLGDKGNNSDQQNAGNNDSNSTNQSDNNTSGNVRNKENQENNIFEDDDQTVFISSNENHYQYSDYKGTSVNGNIVDGTSLSPRKPVLTRNEPIFFIESTQERQRQHLFSSPIKLENQHSTISGFRRHYDNVSVADLRDFSVDIEKHNKNNSKFDINKNEDIKENIAVSESSLNSGYLSNSNKHSEPFYNKSMFSPRRKHHRRKSKDSSHQESGHDTKRSRRHRELSPIVWNFTGSTKPSVNNYKLTYSKTSSNYTPRFSIHSHGNLSETPISVRKSLPDLSGIDKHRSTKVTHDPRYLENGVLPLAQSIDVSHTLSQLSKLDTTHPQLPKIKLNGTQSTSHSNSKFPSTWKPRKPGRTVSGNLMDVPPSPLLNQRLHHDRPN